MTGYAREITYGQAIAWTGPGGTRNKVEVTGCASAEEALSGARKMAFDQGYKAPRWWQFWRRGEPKSWWQDLP